VPFFLSRSDRRLAQALLERSINEVGTFTPLYHTNDCRLDSLVVLCYNFIVGFAVVFVSLKCQPTRSALSPWPTMLPRLSGASKIITQLPVLIFGMWLNRYVSHRGLSFYALLVVSVSDMTLSLKDMEKWILGFYYANASVGLALICLVRSFHLRFFYWIAITT
jgi:hypothetical protein